VPTVVDVDALKPVDDDSPTTMNDDNRDDSHDNNDNDNDNMVARP
jgi:hypothetical protein